MVEFHSTVRLRRKFGRDWRAFRVKNSATSGDDIATFETTYIVFLLRLPPNTYHLQKASYHIKKEHVQIII